MNHVRLFKGGLGDIIAQCYITDSYTRLDDLRVDDTMTTIFASPNRCAKEIITHHPNYKRVNLIEVPLSSDFNAVEHGRSSLEGVPIPDHPHSRGGRPVVFYPSNVDMDVLRVVDGDRYVVFGLSSGSVSHVIPENVSRMAIEAARRHGFRVVFIGRNYAGHYDSTGFYDSVMISLIDRLSVPGTLRLISHAAGVFTAFSSPLLMAHFMGRPFFTAYPKLAEWEIPVFRDRIYDGRKIDLKHCHPFEGVTAENLDLFFAELR